MKSTKTKHGIKSWPKSERPRELLLEKGPEYVSDAGLVAILLRIGIEGKDAVTLGRELLKNFGGLRGLLSADKKDLENIKGLGTAKIAQLLAATEIAKRQLKEEIVGKTVINGPEDVLEYLSLSMSNLKEETREIVSLARIQKISKMRHIQYGNRRISFRIERSNRKKTLGIYISPKTGVVVRSPRFLKVDKILEIVKKRARWIIEKQELVRNQGHLGSVKEFVSGESFPYLGKQYRLKVMKSASKEEKCKLINGRFLVEVNWELKGQGIKRTLKKTLINWYLQRAEEKIPERVKLYAPKIGKWPQRVEIKNHKRQWGSCSHSGIVRFNWKIIMAPVTILDYVIVHELCHLIHQHHSSQFWQKVQTIIPDYAKRRDKLRQYSLQIGSFD